MKTIVSFASRLLVPCLLGVCGITHANEDDVRAVAASNLAFATDLYPRLAANDRNLVFCPPGVASLLALASAGSRGPTRTALLSVLHLPGASERTIEAFGEWQARLAGDWLPTLVDSRSDGITLEWTTTILSDPSHPLLAAFQDMARLKFNAQIPTEPSLESGTGLVLKSHVHFLGHWDRAFATEDTKPGPFFLAKGGSVPVPFMHTQARFKLFHVVDRWLGLGQGGLRLLALPYGNGTYSMVVLLPDHRTGLAGLERSLSATTLGKWLEALDRSEPTSVILSLPRFDTHSELGLKDALTSMGLGPACRIYVADFSRLSQEPTFISKVMQTAAVKVDETGTEDRADTAIVLPPFGVSSTPRREPKVVQVDHPFIFLIRDNTTGAPLFLGRIINPSR